MTEGEAYGLVVLASLFTAIVVWLACWRYWTAKRLPEHDGYVRGFDACSRIRDRHEAEDRKALLLNACVSDKVADSSDDIRAKLSHYT